ncbi:hypothetical protein, partial [Helicobacter pylori]|uniref:hypothetical protein n=1 Tax=Helicobacter pylori TaxID=210 RepID=UPI001179A154
MLNTPSKKQPLKTTLSPILGLIFKKALEFLNFFITLFLALLLKLLFFKMGFFVFVILKLILKIFQIHFIRGIGGILK